MSITVPSQAFGANNGGGGGNALSASFSPTTGNTLVVVAFSGNPTAFSDPAGSNTYTQVTAASDTGSVLNGVSAFVYVAKNITGWTSGQITATMPGGVTFAELYVCEVAGLGASPTTDVAIYTQSTGNVTTVPSSTYSTTNAAEVVIAFGMNDGNNAASALKVGANATTQVTDSQTGPPGIAGYFITSSTLTSVTSQYTKVAGFHNYNIGVISLAAGGTNNASPQAGALSFTGGQHKLIGKQLIA